MIRFLSSFQWSTNNVFFCKLTILCLCPTSCISLHSDPIGSLDKFIFHKQVPQRLVYSISFIYSSVPFFQVTLTILFFKHHIFCSGLLNRLTLQYRRVAQIQFFTMLKKKPTNYPLQFFRNSSFTKIPCLLEHRYNLNCSDNQSVCQSGHQRNREHQGEIKINLSWMLILRLDKMAV